MEMQDVKQSKKNKKQLIEELDKRLDYTNEKYMILDKEVYDVETELRDIIAVSTDINYQIGIVRAYVNMAAHFTLKEDHEEALAYMKKAKTLVDYRLVPETYYSRVSQVYMMYYADLLGDIDTASDYYELGLSAAKKAGDSLNIMVMKGNFASLLIDNGRYEDALKLLDEAKAYIDDSHEFIRRYMYESFGRALLGLERLEESKEYFDKAFEIAEVENDIIIRNCALRGLARIHMKKDELNKAADIIKKTIVLNKNGERVFDQFEAMVELGEIYGELGLYEDAYNELNGYMDYALDANDRLSYRFFEIMGFLCQQLKKYDDAYRFEKISHEKHVKLVKNQGINQSQDIMVKEYREHIDRLKVLARVGERISRSKNLDEVVDILYKKLMGIMKYDVIAIGHLVDDELHYNHYQVGGKTGKPITYKVQKDKNFVGWVLENDKELLISNIQEEYKKYVRKVHYLYTDDIEEIKDCQSIMFMPIKIEGEIIGIFTMQSYEVSAYSAGEYELFRILSTYITGALLADWYHRGLDM